MTGEQCAQAAMGLLDGNPIPYVLGGETIQGMDCQGLIEYVVRRLGGEMRYRGSNDMFRNACSYLAPLSQAQREGRLVPGAVLFILKQDGGELPRYQDGKGNASHVGWYTGGRYEVVHASSSRGKVAPSTLKNGWTHAGWLKAVEYPAYSQKDLGMEDSMSEPISQATVVAESGNTVRMRISPDIKTMAIANVPIGTEVTVLEKDPRWWKINYDEKIGWMIRDFLEEAQTVTLLDDIAAGESDHTALLLDLRGQLLRGQEIINTLLEAEANGME